MAPTGSDSGRHSTPQQACSRHHIRTTYGGSGTRSVRLVIYLDSSVALAHLFGEPRSPPVALWAEQLTSSKLLEYEIWNRVHAYDMAETHSEAAQALVMRVILVEMNDRVFARALAPFPLSVRTLDSLHLATMAFVEARGHRVELASYDHRLIDAARALGIQIVTFD